MIPFGEFRPDSEGVNSGHLVEAKNVLPISNGYVPAPSLESTTDALPARPFGSAAIITDTGGEFFAGTTATLQQLSGTSWTDVTRTVGGAYALGTDEFWTFTAFGELVIAHHIGDDIQKFNVSTSTDFEVLGGSPPRARYSTVVNNFLVLGNLVGNARKIRWSDLNDAEEWTIATTLSDEQEFADGGPILALTSGGEVGYIFQRDAIRRMIFLPGDPRIFQIDKIEGERGVLAAGSVVQVGSLTYYLGRDGFYVFDGDRSRPIGEEKVDITILDDIVANDLPMLRATSDPLNNRIYWCYSSSDGSGQWLDRCIIYDWVLDRWAVIDEALVDLFRFITAGQSLEDLDSISASIDALGISLDSPQFEGGKLSLGGFDTAFKLGFFTGSNLAATLETSDFQPTDNARSYINEITPIADSTLGTVRMGRRDRKGDSIVWGPDNPIEVNGTVPAHVEGRYLRGRFNPPPGS
jgi:hypothetical protein